MTDYVNTFIQLGAELRNLRKLEALFEHSHFVDNANFSKRLIDAAYDDAVVEEEAAQTSGSAALEGAITPAIQSTHGQQIAAFEAGFFPVLDVEIATSPEDKTTGAISYVYDGSLTSGQISILDRRGRFGKLRKKMIADAQTIKKNTITFGVLTPDSTSIGVLAVSGAFSGEDHALSGLLTFEVTDDTIDRAQLSVTNTLTKKLVDDTPTIGGDNPLTVGQNWQDGPTGVTVKLVLGPVVKSGDTIAGIWTLFSITNPTESDSNKGAIYVRTTRQGAAPIWLIEWFKDAALTTRIASATADGTVGTTTIAMKGGGGMTLSSTFSLANAAADMPAATNSRTVTFDIKSPRIGDRFTATISNDEAGNFATKIARRYRASLNSVGGGVETIADAGASSISMI